MRMSLAGRRAEQRSLRLWPAGPVLGAVFIAAIVVIAAVFFAGWELLGVQKLESEKKLTSKTLFELVKISFGAMAGAGALVALVVAYRRQRVDEARQHLDEEGALREATRLHTERFTTAVSQLGDASAAVRLGGVHALAGLANDAPTRDLRQTCIDVLCAYLRLPYTPKADLPQNDTAARHEYLALREVRHTVIRLVRDHLRLPPEHPHCWRGHDFDFTGAVLDGGDLSDAVFSSGTVSFADAEFSGGLVSFACAVFSGGMVDFSRAVFSGGTVDFSQAEFLGGRADFQNATFSGGEVDFSHAGFVGVNLGFQCATFSDGRINFFGAHISGRSISFHRATISGGEVSFRGAEFVGGIVDFTYAELSGGTVTLRGAKLPNGKVTFRSATLTGGMVDFTSTRCTGGIVDFLDLLLSGGIVDFRVADLSGGRVDFNHAQFSGGAVNFRSAVCAEGTVNFSGSRFSGGEIDLSMARGAAPDGLPTPGEPIPAGLLLPGEWRPA
jgi:uncharacterized protein YjbI with pentapeptide repeats